MLIWYFAIINYLISKYTYILYLFDEEEFIHEEDFTSNLYQNPVNHGEFETNQSFIK